MEHSQTGGEEGGGGGGENGGGWGSRSDLKHEVPLFDAGLTPQLCGLPTPPAGWGCVMDGLVSPLSPPLPSAWNIRASVGLELRSCCDVRSADVGESFPLSNSGSASAPCCL
uniref:Uncharacterized protein n=1 Tax=Knipowitschia caucasica TaxID=637954 RepID=A0AAV2J1K0_KNICA